MKQYNTFIFDSYEFHEQTGEIQLRYSLDDEVHFTEKITLTGNPKLEIRNSKLDSFLFMLHLIGGMSYYKTCCPKQMEIRSGTLTQKQAEFWNTVYTQGLGEFFFKNSIDFRGLISFPVNQSTSKQGSKNSITNNKKQTTQPNVLVPIGGGKDSLVTIELLKKSSHPLTLLRVGEHPIINKMASIAGLPLLNVKRALAPELFDLNAQGALNGHVPITAYLSILSLVLAELLGYTHVIFSNERSASEGNTELFGTTINHQWSKSLEFEKMLRAYVQDLGIENVDYFSLLRPLSELSVVQLFAEYPQYFETFTSCNANWKILATPKPNPPPRGEGKREGGNARWCGHCPKCAFAFAMLAAFLSKEEVVNIFGGKNLFEDESLLPLFRELLGLEGIKPFECVGTPAETFAALAIADESGEWADTAVMKMFAAEAIPAFPHAEDTVDSAFVVSDEHCIPDAFQNLLPL